MSLAIGGIIAIALIFIIYYAAQHIDTLPARQKTHEQLKRDQSALTLKDLDLRQAEIQLKREMLEFERDRLSLPRKDAPTEYKILEDKTEDDEQ